MYPAVPTRGELILTGPLFPRARVQLSSGKVLRVDAPQSGQYIHGLKVDGRSTTKPWISQHAVRHGGTLSYTLQNTPDKVSGSRPGDTPPQER